MVNDIYAFMNVGFTNSTSGYRYLCCADCEIGPIGLHQQDRPDAIYVAKKRVTNQN